MERKALVFIREKFEGQSVVGAEVGVARGTNALHILKCMPNLRLLYLVDPYEHYPDWTSTRAKDRLYWPKDLRLIKYQAQQLLSPFESRIAWINKFFEVCTIKDIEPLDFIYIDGNHACDYVLKDIEVARKLVKKGGVISGHDFHPESPSPDSDEVYKAVTEYCKEHNVVFSHEYEDWWFIN